MKRSKFTDSQIMDALTRVSAPPLFISGVLNMAVWIPQ